MGTHLLARNLLSGQVSEVSALNLRVLEFCDDLRTLEEHADGVRNSLGPGAAALNIPRSLGKLLELGLLMEEACTRCELDGADDLGDAPTPIEWLTIPTRNRTDVLERGLYSYSQNFARFGRKPKILVSDDSDLHNIRQENVTALARLVKNTGLEIYYCDDACREELAAAISDHSGVPIEIVRRACCNSGHEADRYGANRNTLLLCTAGSLILSVDDDTVCRMAEPVNHSRLRADAVVLSGDIDVTSTALFPDQRELQVAISETQADILASHETLLGRPLVGYLGRLPPGTYIDTKDICSHLADALHQRQGRIGITFNGQWGTLGVNNLAQLMMTRPPSLHRPGAFVGNELQITPPGIRFSANPTICHGGFCMSTFIGIDNRSVLPPFPAKFRNEDGIFGTLLSVCSPHTFMVMCRFACYTILPVSVRFVRPFAFAFPT